MINLVLFCLSLVYYIVYEIFFKIMQCYGILYSICYHFMSYLIPQFLIIIDVLSYLTPLFDKIIEYCLVNFVKNILNYIELGIYESGHIFVLNTLLDLFFFFLFQMFFFVFCSVWGRASGPRTRLDQLSSLTWKDLVVYLLSLTLMIFMMVIFA